MKINTNISENSGLVCFSKLPHYTPFTMPGNGIGSLDKFFIKLNMYSALVFNADLIEEVRMNNDVWVKLIVEIDIKITVR